MTVMAAFQQAQPEEIQLPNEVDRLTEYQKPGIKIGHGKYHPIELIIARGELFALKKIPKQTIDK